MIRARDFSPLLGVVVCFLVASVTLYITASSLSSRLEDGYVFCLYSINDIASWRMGMSFNIFNMYLSVCYMYMYMFLIDFLCVCMHACMLFY